MASPEEPLIQFKETAQSLFFVFLICVFYTFIGIALFKKEILGDWKDAKIYKKEIKTNSVEFNSWLESLKKEPIDKPVIKIVEDLKIEPVHKKTTYNFTHR